MKSAEIQNGIVVNIILGMQPGYIACSDSVAIGDLYSNGTFTRPAPLTFVPASVSMRQARLALQEKGLLDQVNTTIAAMPGAAGVAARIEWQVSSVVERDKPLVISLAAVLGLTDEQINDLFIAAASL